MVQGDSRLEQRELFQSIANTITATLNLPTCIWVLDEKAQALRIAGAVGLRPAHVKRAVLKLDEPSVTGVAFQTGQPLAIRNILEDDRWKYRKEAENRGWKSVLCVPIKVADRTLGVVSIYTIVEREFNPSEQELLERYAALIGASFENARRGEMLRRLFEVGQVVEESIVKSPKAVLRRIVKGAREVSGADCAVIYPYDPYQKKFYDVDRIAAHGLRTPLRVLEINRPREERGMAARISREEKLVVNDIERDRPEMLQDSFIAREGVRAFMGTALKIGEEVLGVLYVDFRRPHQFTQDEQDIIQLLSHQAATAIYNSRLFEQTTSRAYTLAQLSDISRSLLSMEDIPRSLDKTLKHIASSAKKVLGADIIDLYPYIEETAEFRLPPTLVGRRKQPLVPPVPTEIFSDDVIVKIVEEDQPQYFEKAQGAPLLSGEYEIERENKPEQRFVFREEIESSAAIPLRAAGETVGVMFVNYRSPQLFHPSRREQIELFANQAAVALYNARLFQNEKRRIETLTTLHSVGQSLVSKLDLSQVLEGIAQSARKVLDADMVDLYQYIQDRDEYILPPILTGERWDSHVPGVEIYDDELVVKMVREKEPRYFLKAQEESSLTGEFKVPRKDAPDQRFVIREGVESSAAIPLKVGEEIVGIMFVNYRTPQLFASEQREQIELFASQAAIATNNARLLEGLKKQREERIETIREIGFGITAGVALSEVLGGLLQKTIDLLGKATLGSIRLIDEETGELVVYASQGELAEEELQSLKVGEGITGWVAQHRKPALVPDVDQDPRFKRFLRGTRSEIAVPMLSGDRLIGVLNVEHPQINAFDEDDLRLLSAIASQAVIAIENARLFQRSQSLAAQLEKLHEVTASVSEERDLEEVLLQILNSVNTILGEGTSSSMNLYDKTRDDLYQYRAAGPWREDLLKTPPRPDGTGRHVIRTGKPIYIEDVRQPPRDHPNIRQEAIDRGVKSFAALPLKRGEDIVGIVFANLAREFHFSSEIRRVLELFANQAAIAIEKARLFEQVEKQKRERIEAIREIGIGITSALDLQEVLDGLLHKTLYLLGEANLGTIRLLDERTGELVVRAHQGRIPAEGFKRLKIGEGMTGWVAEHKKSTIVPNVAEDPRYVRSFEESQSEMAVPLLIEGRLIGVINIEHSRVNAFTEEDCLLLEAIASQAAIAIRNASLFESERRRLETLTILHSIGQSLVSELGLSQVLEEIAQNAPKVLEADIVTLYQYFEAEDKFEVPPVMTGSFINETPMRDKVNPDDIVVRIVRDGKSRFADDVWEEPLLSGPRTDGLERPRFVEREGIKSSAGILLKMEDEIVGVMFINYRRPITFDSEEQSKIEILANQAALAIRNARLYQSLERKVKELEALSTLGAQLSAVPLE